MKEEKKAPDLRFPGFTDPWEQCKLGDECNQLTTVINPQNEPNRLFAEYSMPAYDLNKNPDYVLGSTMNSARKVVDRPCLLINKLNVRKKRIWCIEGPEKNAVCSAEFIPVCSEGIDLRFLSYVVSGNAFTSYLEDCSSGSSNSQKRVTPDTIMNAEICIPSRAEQQKIGAYFKDLDHLIVLHQRKVDDLKTMKKCLLQKMFPKEGENTPELRFPGFTDPWEQRKFGDEFKLSQGLQVPVEEQFVEQLENTEQFIRIIDVTQEGEPPRYVYNPTGKGRVKTDDIFFVRYGAVGTIGYGYNGVIANNLFKAEPLFKACNMFLFQQFSGTDFNKKLKEMSASTSMPAVNFGALNNLTFCIPSYEEQNKIGEYFGQLDNLITLHQRKVDDLKTMKKCLLQKMFI